MNCLDNTMWTREKQIIRKENHFILELHFLCTFVRFIYVPFFFLAAIENLWFIPSFASLRCSKQFCQSKCTDSRWLKTDHTPAREKKNPIMFWWLHLLLAAIPPYVSKMIEVKLSLGVSNTRKLYFWTVYSGYLTSKLFLRCQRETQQCFSAKYMALQLQITS